MGTFINPKRLGTYVQSDPEDIARFLHSANNSLGKEQLGILLAEKYFLPAPLSLSLGTEPSGASAHFTVRFSWAVSSEDIFPAVLQAFIGQMDFHMFDFDIALRKVRPPSNQDL